MYAGLISTSKAEQKLSDLRLKICSACFYSGTKEIVDIIEGNVTSERAMVCKKCKCPCRQKTLVVDESCPIAKW